MLPEFPKLEEDKIKTKLEISAYILEQKFNDIISLHILR